MVIAQIAPTAWIPHVAKLLRLGHTTLGMKIIVAGIVLSETFSNGR